MNDFNNDPRRQQELRMRPIADNVYRSVFGHQIEIARHERKENLILDVEFAIDVNIRFPSQMLLLGQEKFLSHYYAKYGSLTIEYEQNQFTGEPGDWFKIGVQFYFVGYCNKDGSGFDPWILVNWPSVVLATHQNQIKWYENKNKDGSARASFRYCYMDNIPAYCVIASSNDTVIEEVI